jgi:hypothetical protein
MSVNIINFCISKGMEKGDEKKENLKHHYNYLSIIYYYNKKIIYYTYVKFLKGVKRNTEEFSNIQYVILK